MTDRPQQDQPHRGRWTRGLYWALGMLMLALAVIGAMLPVMPTTIFVILAAACFGRASPRWEAWLMQHPVFGPPLVAWREHGAISVRGKIFAVLGMTAGLACFWYFAQPDGWLGALVSLFMLGCAIWLVRRPTPPAS